MVPTSRAPRDAPPTLTSPSVTATSVRGSLAYATTLNVVPTSRMTVRAVFTTKGWRGSWTTENNASPSSSTVRVAWPNSRGTRRRVAGPSVRTVPSRSVTLARAAGGVSKSRIGAKAAGSQPRENDDGGNDSGQDCCGARGDWPVPRQPCEWVRSCLARMRVLRSATIRSVPTPVAAEVRPGCAPRSLAPPPSHGDDPARSFPTR